MDPYAYQAEYFALHQDCQPAERPLAPQAGGGAPPVRVAYASDARGFAGLLPSMLSLGRQLAEPGGCSLHVVVPGADIDKAKDMVECFRRELSDLPAIPKVELHALVERTSVNISEGWRSRHHRPELINPLNFARFYLHEYLPDAPRVLWLDLDTIVLSDIAPLFQSEMQHVVAAVPRNGLRGTVDYIYSKHPAIRRGSPGARAFNPGVLLIDLKRWRSESMVQRVESWVQVLFDDWENAANESELWQKEPEPTQSPLNLACDGAFDHIDWRWNVLNLGVQGYFLRRGVPSRCVEEARILHWNGPEKPWRPGGGHHQHSELYARYRPKQPCDALQ